MSVVVNAAVEERETLPAKLSEGINALESTERTHVAIPASKSISLNFGLSGVLGHVLLFCKKTLVPWVVSQSLVKGKNG